LHTETRLPDAATVAGHAGERRRGEEKGREEKRRKEEGQWETIRKVLRRRERMMRNERLRNGSRQ
jgi:hypothetical protein